MMFVRFQMRARTRTQIQTHIHTEHLYLRTFTILCGFKSAQYNIRAYAHGQTSTHTFAYTRTHTHDVNLLSPTFQDAFNGSDSTQLNIQIQTHAYAPGGDGLGIVSPLFGLSLYNADDGSEAVVQNLTEPFVIKIPVDTKHMNSLQKLVFAQRARCAYWRNGSYVTDGCSVTVATLREVTCACNHLTTFVISQDLNAPACGNGLIETGEECDDLNLTPVDGCDSACHVESTHQ